MRAFGVDDTVVVVEDFVDGYGDGKVRICGKDVVLGFEGAVVAYNSINQSIREDTEHCWRSNAYRQPECPWGALRRSILDL